MAFQQNMPQKTPQIDATTRETNSNRRHKMSTPERTITVRLHVPWDAESSERLYAVCRTQDTCWNLAGTQGRGQAVLGGARSSKGPS